MRGINCLTSLVIILMFLSNYSYLFKYFVCVFLFIIVYLFNIKTLKINKKQSITKIIKKTLTLYALAAGVASKNSLLRNALYGAIPVPVAT